MGQQTETKTGRELWKQEIRKDILKQRSKLVLWQTRYCKPILTRNELLPIMANLGFVALPITRREQITTFDGHEIPWTEFKYYGSSANDRVEPLRSKSRPIRIKNNKKNNKPPRNPRLPYYYIDGLHLYTYRAFLDAINSYLGSLDGAGTFHLQGIPANLDDLELENWIYVEKFGIIVRRGTLDPNDVFIYYRDVLDFSNLQMLLAKDEEVPVDGDDPEIITMVPMDDIIVVIEHKNSSTSGEGGEQKAEIVVNIGNNK